MQQEENDYTADIEHCLEVLHAGGVILYPTDTIWGLGCDATNEKAVEKIIQIKERPAEKSFVVLVSSERDVLRYVASPDPLVFNYLATAQRPTTVIYENALGLAENVLAKDGSVGIRICRDEFCRHLLKRFRKPIVSTSANVSGELSPQLFIQINKQLIQKVDYTVKYRQSEQIPAVSSSIIKWSNNGVLVIR